MSYIQIAETIKQSAGGGAVTTDPADMTNATLFVAVVAGYKGINPIGLVTDSSGANTWNPLTQYGTPDNADVVLRLFYVISPTTSAAQTFSVGAASTFCTLEVSGWESGNTPVLDQADGGGGPQAPTGVSPAQAFDLMIVGLAILGVNGTPATINQGFSVMHFADTSGGNAQGGAAAYFLDNSGPTAKNPTWGAVSSTGSATAIASFTEASGGGGGKPITYYAQQRQRQVTPRDRFRRSMSGRLFVPPYLAKAA